VKSRRRFGGDSIEWLLLLLLLLLLLFQPLLAMLLRGSSAAAADQLKIGGWLIQAAVDGVVVGGDDVVLFGVNGWAFS
jgi:hypothetical protein